MSEPSDTFTQPRITGYRQLNAEEARLMNVIKSHGAALEDLTKSIGAYLVAQQQRAQEIANGEERVAELRRINDAGPHRWLSIGITDAQKALMALVRAIAQPGSF